MPDKLVIYHYHYLPGGVSSVVRQALVALRDHLPGIGEILLVGGRVPEEMRQEARAHGARAQALPEIDYHAPPGLTRRRVAVEGQELAGRLKRLFGGPDCLWWVHNHHLGKNPVFTEALLRVLSADPSQRAVLQIHDFPECGRLDALRRLRRTLGSSPYPTGPHVRYAVLTGRDREVLLEAGLPAEAVHLLENPVPRFDRPPLDRAAVRRALATAFPDRAGDLDPARRLLFYPVRTIRRKNVLEAMALTRLLDAALLVTLPGVSKPERGYSRLVQRAFAAGLCRGVWGTGLRLPAGPRQNASALSFDALPAGCDMVLSSSVQEGFGYLFVNALQWGLPLAGRDLDTLAGLRPLLHGYPAHMYERLLCPLRSGETADLRRAYERKLRALRTLYDPPCLDLLREEIRAALKTDLVDFSYLSVPGQLRMLRCLARDDRLQAARQANADLLAGLQGLLESHPAPFTDAVQARFGAQAFARSFGRLAASFATPAGPARTPQTPGDVWQRVVRRFARLEHLRLLYDF